MPIDAEDIKRKIAHELELLDDEAIASRIRPLLIEPWLGQRLWEWTKDAAGPFPVWTVADDEGWGSLTASMVSVRKRPGAIFISAKKPSATTLAGFRRLFMRFSNWFPATTFQYGA
jgi:hypothetical protein